MFATATAHRQPFTHALQSLRAVLGLAFGRGQARAIDREEADLEDMSPHALDVLELLSGEGCVSDWGLVERAAQLRCGWA
jgi:hypothetical protein